MENNDTTATKKSQYTKGFQISCYQIWEDYTDCFKPYPQYQNIRRYGEVLDCQNFYDDWKNCLFSKTQSKEKADAAYLASNYYKKLTEKKSDTIFVMKSKPSWNWEDKDGGGSSSSTIENTVVGKDAS